MEWIEPKTDWKVEYDENGNYIGDYLNIADINRMSNNLSYVMRECKSLYETNSWFDSTNPPYIATIGEILDVNILLAFIWNIQVINRFVRSEEVADVVNTGILKISRDQTPTWEFYNAVERIMKLEHEQMVRVANDKRKLRYQFGIPNTGGF